MAYLQPCPFDGYEGVRESDESEDAGAHPHLPAGRVREAFRECAVEGGWGAVGGMNP
jgi:hypothetical protein